ncbi:MAG TPA: hypothetical protein QF644_02245, partial [Candidatus Poseidoniaceae archaeon]|nr:hypothetical protein [Candidatus Poseidoniaceae archaeon]
MYDEPGNEKSFFDKIRYWLREESDMQWLSIGVFFMIIIAGAFFFDHANVLSGWVQSDVSEQGTLIDIDWNDDGSKALAIFSDSGNKKLMSWDNEDGWNLITSDSEPNAVDWGTYLQHWYIGTNDGIEVWNGIETASNQMAMNWPENSTNNRVVDISSDGIEGFIITQTTEGSMIHYFNGPSVSKGTYPPSTGNEGSSSDDVDSVEEEDTTEDDLQQIGTNIATYENHVQLTHVEMINNNPARALVIGSSSVFGINPTNALTIGSLYDVWASDIDNPNIQLIHSKAGVELSQIINLEDSWGENYEAVVIGATDCLIINIEGIVSELCEEGGSSGAIDSDGNLWITSATNSLEIRKISCAGEHDSHVTKNLLLPEKYEINSRLATMSGEEVQFYGIDNEGKEVKATLDTSASQSVLRSMDMLGQLIVFIIAISVFGATIWQFYENRGKG